MENFLCKTIPSQHDDRDWNAGNIYKNTILEPVLDLRDSLEPIRNQGTQGTCAAQTAACMKEWQETNDYNFKGYMSPQFIYNNRENQTTEGMFGRDVMRILSKIGSVEEDTYEYGKIEPIENIDEIYYSKAKVHKIKNYARVYDIENLKKALKLNGPCYIAFPVYNANSMRMWFKESESSEMQGGHAMTVVGYNEEGFIIRNTWGIHWGDKGYCIYSYSDWGSHWEIWTTIDEKSYIEDIDIEEKENSYDTDSKDSKDSIYNADSDSEDETDDGLLIDKKESMCEKLYKLLKQR
tara:strand:+ start:2065 stop:2946 length:882 start_codon:yes stop_codon:yes gene_type:complete